MRKSPDGPEASSWYDVVTSTPKRRRFRLALTLVSSLASVTRCNNMREYESVAQTAL